MYIVPSSFNVSLVWFLNLFGVKVWILNLRKVQRVTINEFLWKCAGMESPDFFVINKVGNRAAVDTYIRPNVVSILRNNCYIDKFYKK